MAKAKKKLIQKNRTIKQSYADLCLKRAKKATKGPWVWRKDVMQAIRVCIEPCDGTCGAETIIETDSGYYPPRANDKEFIAHARADIPELARRLKRAIQGLNHLNSVAWLKTTYKTKNGVKRNLKQFIDELEAIPEEK